MEEKLNNNAKTEKQKRKYRPRNNKVNKTNNEGEKTKHITIEDKEFEAVLTENLKSKLKHAGISEANLKVKLD